MITKSGDLIKLSGMKQKKLRYLVSLIKKNKMNPDALDNILKDDLVLGRINRRGLDTIRDDALLPRLEQNNGRWIMSSDDVKHIINNHIVHPNLPINKYNTKQLKQMLNNIGNSVDTGSAWHVGTYTPMIAKNRVVRPLIKVDVADRQTALPGINRKTYANLWPSKETGDVRIHTIYPKTNNGINNIDGLDVLKDPISISKRARVFSGTEEYNKLIPNKVKKPTNRTR